MKKEVLVPHTVEKPGGVYCGTPQYLTTTRICSNCGKEFNPLSNLQGGSPYERTLRKKDITLTSKYGRRFHFADTPEFHNKQSTIRITCCSHTCCAQIESVNEENVYSGRYTVGE